jgi:hypothetical protein
VVWVLVGSWDGHPSRLSEDGKKRSMLVPCGLLLISSYPDQKGRPIRKSLAEDKKVLLRKKKKRTPLKCLLKHQCEGVCWLTSVL